jgi:hypothetical protein
VLGQVSRHRPVAEEAFEELEMLDDADMLTTDHPVGQQRCEHDDGSVITAVEEVPEHRGEVVFLASQPAHCLQLPGAEDVIDEALTGIHRPLFDGILDLLGLCRFAPAEVAVFTDGLEHSETYSAVTFDDSEQGLVDEVLDRPHGRGLENVLDAVRTEGIGQEGHRHQRRLRVVVEQLPGPVDDRLQGLMPLRRRSVTSAQKDEPIGEVVEDRFGR